MHVPQIAVLYRVLFLCLEGLYFLLLVFSLYMTILIHTDSYPSSCLQLFSEESSPNLSPFHDLGYLWIVTLRGSPSSMTDRETGPQGPSHVSLAVPQFPPWQNWSHAAQTTNSKLQAGAAQLVRTVGAGLYRVCSWFYSLHIRL